MYFSIQNEEQALLPKDIVDLIDRHISAHQWNKVLLIPPDITRAHSGSGKITALYYERLTHLGCEVKVLPALGTHCPMTEDELHRMFGGAIPLGDYIEHDFRKSVVEIGVVPGLFLKEISEGLFYEDVHVSINRELLDKTYDAILSIGQVIPHEIVGMANYTKNIVIGCGGGELINVSHFLGVFWGLNRILGVDKTPVRLLFDYIQEHLLNKIPLTFIQTVMVQLNGEDRCKGLFIGQGRAPYENAVTLSRKVNLNYVERPIQKCVVYMDPDSYHSTWVTNKAIYRTQLAVKQGGEIIVIAPGVHMFGENEIADTIIRKYGYLSQERALELYRTEKLLQDNLSITGHLIHGAPEGIQVTYCTDGLSRQEIEKANFHYLSIEEAMNIYPCQKWENGWHVLPSGEEIYFVSNAALGLWCYDERKIMREG